MNKNDYTIRLETQEDRRAVENLIRESFWNVYCPGCSEHYVIHVLRDDPAFVKELDLVMEQDGRIIGQNMFMRTVIEADDGRTVIVKREKICDNCQGAQPAVVKDDEVTLFDFLSGLSADQQRAALVHLSVLWAEKQAAHSNKQE